MCVYNIDPLGDTILTLANPNNYPPALDECVVATEPEPPGEAPPVDKPVPVPVTFLVSSHHLVLASPVFKAMMNGGWNEGNKKEGRFRVRTEDWDVEALTIVMNVLHSHYRQVPKTVTLKMLAKISVIVDYYKIQEAFQPMVLLWMLPLESQVPSTSFSPDDVLWILISWVFEDEKVFTQTTKAAILWGKEDIVDSNTLPIPPVVIDRINQHRKESLRAIAAGLQSLQQAYTEGRQGCSFECSARQLGTLIKNMHDLKLLGHPPKRPFGRYISVVQVVERIGTMKSRSWYNPPAFSGFDSNLRVHQCTPKEQSEGKIFQFGVGNTIKETLGNLPLLLAVGVKNQVKGLGLADFTSGNKKD